MTALLPSKVRSDAWADDSEEPDAHVGGRKRDVAWSDIQHTYRDMFGSTVARQLVHKLAVSDVLITDAVEAGRDLLILAAQWPRQHHYYSVAGGALDLVLIAETLRQATILCAHRFYAVPLGHAFLMDRLIVKRDVGHGRRGVPQEVMIKVEMDRVERRHGRLLSLRSSVEFKIGSQIVGAGQGYLRVVDPRVYARMRGSAKPPATGATLDSFVRGVALSPVEAAVELPRRWQLHLDRTHAVFFDPCRSHSGDGLHGGKPPGRPSGHRMGGRGTHPLRRNLHAVRRARYLCGSLDARGEIWLIVTLVCRRHVQSGWFDSRCGSRQCRAATT